MRVRQLTRDQARRIAVRAQLLDEHEISGLEAVVERLTLLQIDPTAAIAPSADLVAWGRCGSGYRPEHLQHALEHERSLFEYRAMIRPMADLALYRPVMDVWPTDNSRARAWMDANESFQHYVLDQLRVSGPLRSRDVEDRSVVPWASTGWTGNRNVTQMLEFLAARGVAAVAGRVGRQRLWDLAERVYPADIPDIDAAEAARRRDARRLRALGVARPAIVGDAGVPAEIDDTRGVWRLDPDASAEPFHGRTALLSPFDRLVHDRMRALDLFDFEYKLEMYVPKAKRRWGYFALPVLHHDRLIGKIDATADRTSSTLCVDRIHRDVQFDAEISAAVDEQLCSLASWLNLRHVDGPAARHR